jgi:hypothetical protein
MEDSAHSPRHDTETADSPSTLPDSISSLFGAAASTVSMTMDDSHGLALVRVKARTMPSPMDEIPVRHLSKLEEIMTACEPILNSILLHLPTPAIRNLSNSSSYLRQFIRSYPLAWKSLSARLPQQSAILGSPGGDSDSRDRHSKLCGLDIYLKVVVLPIATRLTNLDLCNTAVSGITLFGAVLNTRGNTLQHLSVRGCKHVSLKYHVVPFLRCYKQELEIPGGSIQRLALKSLYTYRCRHHRRRPYLPASLFRRDSDSEPTHELIELCHSLGIWTDTAWCPTPGPRCFRRKDYRDSRAAQGLTEVWVPFDRLWRSGNRTGPTSETSRNDKPVGKLWEEIECGHDGEALGTGTFAGEGKDVPNHQRKSHRQFVEDVKCDDCGELIQERCETCSIKMHCMGCRKTLCSSCAFNKPYHRHRPLLNSSARMANLSHTLERSRAKTKKKPNKFWWAPGARRSPNVMIDAPEDSDSETEGHLPPPQPLSQSEPLKLLMNWCCLEPLFSGGGGVAFVGPGLGGIGSERIRAVPLPKQREYLDSDFAHTSQIPPLNFNDLSRERAERFDEIVGANIDILPYLQQASLNLQTNTCPRSLCQSCYLSFRWKASCSACKRPICKEHDFRALKVRKCGFRELTEEREYVRNAPQNVGDLEPPNHDWPSELRIPAFRRPPSPANSSVTAGGDDERRARSGAAEDSLEESDAGSAVDGPGTRDPSSTPRAVPGPSVDRSSSVRSPDSSFGRRSNDASMILRGDALGGDKTPRSRSPSGLIELAMQGLRVRSTSMSELTPSRTGLPIFDRASRAKNRLTGFSRANMLLPGAPGHPVQWKGCGQYFCQGTRAMGDGRARCVAQGKDCVECGVYMCEVSLQ